MEVIEESHEFLPYQEVQDLSERLLEALRNHLERELLGVVDDHELTLTPWALRQAERLGELRALDAAEDPDTVEALLDDLDFFVDCVGEPADCPDCLSKLTHGLYHAILQDRLILSMLAAAQEQALVPDFVSAVVPLYAAFLDTAAHGRNDFWCRQACFVRE